MHSSFLSRRETSAAERLPEVSKKNGPNPFSVIPVRFFSSSDFMILF